MMTWWFTTFMAPAIKQKVHNLPGVEYLYEVMSPEQLEIPAYITEYDMTVRIPWNFFFDTITFPALNYPNVFASCIFLQKNIRKTILLTTIVLFPTILYSYYFLFGQHVEAINISRSMQLVMKDLFDRKIYDKTIIFFISTKIKN